VDPSALLKEVPDVGMTMDEDDEDDLVDDVDDGADVQVGLDVGVGLEVEVDVDVGVGVKDAAYDVDDAVDADADDVGGVGDVGLDTADNVGPGPVVVPDVGLDFLPNNVDNAGAVVEGGVGAGAGAGAAAGAGVARSTRGGGGAGIRGRWYAGTKGTQEVLWVVSVNEPAGPAAAALGRGMIAVVIDADMRPVGTLRGAEAGDTSAATVRSAAAAAGSAGMAGMAVAAAAAASAGTGSAGLAAAAVRRAKVGRCRLTPGTPWYSQLTPRLP